MMKLQQLIKDRRGHWPERAIGPTVPDGRLSRWTGSSSGAWRRGSASGWPDPSASATTRPRSGSRPADVRTSCAPSTTSRSSRFEFLADLAGVDTGDSMQVVYHLWSETTPDWLRVIADGLSRDDPACPSVTFLWKGAEWMEREAYDMFGITFEGNRDLRRIYMPPGLHELPAPQGLLPCRRCGAVAGRGRPPRGAAPHPAQPPAGIGQSARHRALIRIDPTDARESPPTTRASSSTRRSASSSRSRRTRRGPSARPSSTRSATARCSSTWGPSTRPRTACSGSCSSSTASRSSISIRSSGTSIGASRSCARTPTTTRRSATSTRSSTSARCSANGPASSPSRSSWTSRPRGGPSTSGS